MGVRIADRARDIHPERTAVVHPHTGESFRSAPFACRLLPGVLPFWHPLAPFRHPLAPAGIRCRDGGDC